MITENLSTLKIHKLTQEQYDRELEAGAIDPNALYLTPDISILIQNDEPTNAEEGSLWIDMDAYGSNSSSSTSNGSGGVDLSNYALKSDIPTKVSQLTNDSEYVTESDVIAYINDAILGGAW